jgi:hypothetical protein
VVHPISPYPRIPNRYRSLETSWETVLKEPSEALFEVHLDCFHEGIADDQQPCFSLGATGSADPIPIPIGDQVHCALTGIDAGPKVGDQLIAYGVNGPIERDVSLELLWTDDPDCHFP